MVQTVRVTKRGATVSVKEGGVTKTYVYGQTAPVSTTKVSKAPTKASPAPIKVSEGVAEKLREAGHYVAPTKEEQAKLEKERQLGEKISTFMETGRELLGFEGIEKSAVGKAKQYFESLTFVKGLSQEISEARGDYEIKQAEIYIRPTPVGDVQVEKRVGKPERIIGGTATRLPTREEVLAQHGDVTPPPEFIAKGSFAAEVEQEKARTAFKRTVGVEKIIPAATYVGKGVEATLTHISEKPLETAAGFAMFALIPTTAALGIASVSLAVSPDPFKTTVELGTYAAVGFGASKLGRYTYTSMYRAYHEPVPISMIKQVTVIEQTPKAQLAVSTAKAEYLTGRGELYKVKGTKVEVTRPLPKEPVPTYTTKTMKGEFEIVEFKQKGLAGEFKPTGREFRAEIPKGASLATTKGLEVGTTTLRESRIKIEQIKGKGEFAKEIRAMQVTRTIKAEGVYRHLWESGVMPETRIEPTKLTDIGKGVSKEILEIGVSEPRPVVRKIFETRGVQVREPEVARFAREIDVLGITEFKAFEKGEIRKTRTLQDFLKSKRGELRQPSIYRYARVETEPVRVTPTPSGLEAEIPAIMKQFYVKPSFVGTTPLLRVGLETAQTEPISKISIRQITPLTELLKQKPTSALKPITEAIVQPKARIAQRVDPKLELKTQAILQPELELKIPEPSVPIVEVPPPPPPTFVIPRLPTMGLPPSRERKVKLRKPPKGYTPSITAAAFKITAPKKKIRKRGLTGFELRPISL